MEKDLSLLTRMATDCCIMDKTTTADGYGGYSVEWKDGAVFTASIVRNSSTEAQIAQKQVTTAFYTITTTKAITLNYHDVVKRLSDGLVLRVTSNSKDNETPEGAGLNMRQVTAEETTLE